MQTFVNQSKKPKREPDYVEFVKGPLCGGRTTVWPEPHVEVAFDYYGGKAVYHRESTYTALWVR